MPLFVTTKEMQKKVWWSLKLPAPELISLHRPHFLSRQIPPMADQLHNRVPLGRFPDMAVPRLRTVVLIHSRLDGDVTGGHAWIRCGLEVSCRHVEGARKVASP